MEVILAFSVILVILVLGDIISTLTKAVIPSVFVQAMLFMLGYWYGMPADIVDRAGFGPIALLSMYLLITHMGTMINFKELMAQWKTVIIALLGLIGIVIGTMTIGQMFFGRELAIIATPPLTGGTVATVLMGEAARQAGLLKLAVLPILVYVGQGFVGYPLTTIMLKREGRRLLKGYRDGSIKATVTVDTTVTGGKFKIFPDIPAKYDSAAFTLLRLGIVGCLAYFSADYLNAAIKNAGWNFTVHKLVLCLIFGVIASEIGFCEKKALNKANSFGFLMTALLGYIFGGLKDSTPQMVLELLTPLCGILFFGIMGMLIVAYFCGKILKESPFMALAISLNALYGFPQNFMLTTESARSLTENDEERQFLIDAMLPKMLVGGFVTVTIASVIIAGIFMGMLIPN